MKGPAILWATVLIAFASPGLAKDKSQYTIGEAIPLDQTMGYVAVRQILPPRDYAASIVLVRMLDSDSYQKVMATRRKNGTFPDPPLNVFFNRIDAPYAVSGEERLFIFAVPPGNYVVAGIGTVNKNSGPMRTCLCMGTVSFAVTAGNITDMGTFLAARDDEPTAIPELQRFIRGYKMADAAPSPYVAAIRPPDQSSALPSAVIALGVRNAEYQAIDKFPNTIGGAVDRLAPLAGVLGYDEDKVLNLKAAPDP